MAFTPVIDGELRLDFEDLDYSRMAAKAWRRLTSLPEPDSTAELRREAQARGVSIRIAPPGAPERGDRVIGEYAPRTREMRMRLDSGLLDSYSLHRFLLFSALQHTSSPAPLAVHSVSMGRKPELQKYLNGVHMSFGISRGGPDEVISAVTQGYTPSASPFSVRLREAELIEPLSELQTPDLVYTALGRAVGNIAKGYSSLLRNGFSWADADLRMARIIRESQDDIDPRTFEYCALAEQVQQLQRRVGAGTMEDGFERRNELIYNLVTSAGAVVQETVLDPVQETLLAKHHVLESLVETAWKFGIQIPPQMPLSAVVRSVRVVSDPEMVMEMGDSGSGKYLEASVTLAQGLQGKSIHSLFPDGLYPNHLPKI